MGSAVRRISVEGNIGCGKSTLLRRLGKEWQVFLEPVADWAQLLKLFYDDPGRWGFAMNLQALLSFAGVPDGDASGRPVVVERSPLSCKEVFARLSLNQDHITSEEWTLFCELEHAYGWKPDIIIYLKSNPNTCLERVRTRSRAAESDVTRDHLTRLQLAHTTMLRFYEEQVHVVDASQDPDTVFQRVKDILDAYS